jgi:hypothetical protein
VDLHQYTTHLKEKIETPAPMPAMDVSRLSIARRPTLDLGAAAPAPAVVTPQAKAAMGGADDIDLDALTAFDVPAFLRREI